ncbi:hypothetical protein H0H92_007955 [Tricholoma furcatifolium]|nr:hypothetical protein H0H92_007955 [Tricholoma furcatifolium]
MTTPSKSKPTLSNLADQDDDLDDLDDVLDQFNPQASGVPPPTPPPTAAAAAAPSSSGRPRTNTRVDAPPKSAPGGLGLGAGLDSTAEVDDEDEISAAFSRDLAKGMEDLMRQLSLGEGAAGTGAGAGSSGDADGKDGEHGNGHGLMNDDETAKAFKAAWEAMLIQGMDGKGHDIPGLEEFLGHGLGAGAGEEEGSSSTGAGAGAGAGAAKTPFQSKIQQAIDKLRESESSLKDSTSKSAGAAGADGLPKELEALLAAMGGAGAGAGEGENEEELAGLLESMMGELMSKEVLYEPLKELSESYPGYLANPPEPLSPADHSRYTKQLECVTKILAVFDKPSYSDSDPASKEAVTTLMSEMQGYGSPPAEVMGPIPPGLGLGPDGAPNGECVVA